MRFDAVELSQRLGVLFRENFERHGELGAAISLWHRGEPLLDLKGGFCDAARRRAWTDQTIVLVWSATKGIGSACLLHCLQENKVSLDRRVSELWPEFGENGKHEITIAQLLSHSAGLCALDQPANVTDYPAVISALEKQQPLWKPGTAHGYHARTFGFLIDELLRRLNRVTLGTYWCENFARPLRLDFWIGLPEHLNSRCATMYAAKAGRPAEPSQFYHALTSKGTLQQKTFTSPSGLHAVSAMNKPEVRALDIVSFGGIGSAHALAKFYAMLANAGQMEARTFFHGETLRHMRASIVDGRDQVFQIPSAFSAGFMKDASSARREFFGPSSAAFGHPGAGGSHAFADPENNIGFAYVMNQMEQTLFPNEKSMRLVNAVYSCHHRE